MYVTELEIDGFERVAVGRDESAGYHGIIAIHSLARGPALGGSRLRPYASENEALDDALRLAHGMSLKSAFAELPFGGGKAVMTGMSSGVSAAGCSASVDMLRAHGEFVQSFGGDFITGEDVGTSVADMVHVRETTSHVLVESPVTVDSAGAAALGVFRAIEGALLAELGSRAVWGRTVAVQGCGMVGGQLARLLAAAGATLLVADAVPGRAAECAHVTRARLVPRESLLDEPCDVLSPCALGNVFTDRSVTRVRTRVIAGAANNQLGSEDIAVYLQERGIHYVPDFVANAGGVIAAATDLLGWSRAAVMARIDRICDSVLRVAEQARVENRTPHAIALEHALEELAR